MKRTGLIVSGVVGLAITIAEALVIPHTITVLASTNTLGLVVALLGALSSGVAGRLILGDRRAHNYYKLSLPVLCAVCGFTFVSALTSYLIAHDVVFGPAPSGIPTSALIAGIVGVVVYLGAAFVYGFAGAKQGVPVAKRIGLLVLLLASVLPYVGVLGFVAWIVVAAVRRPDSPSAEPEAPTTPGLPAASE